MGQISSCENGLRYGALHVSTGHEASQKLRKYPKWLFVAVNTVLLLLAGVAILLSLYLSGLFSFSSVGSESCEVQYTLELYEAGAVLDPAALEGAVITDAESGVVIGRVLTAVKSTKRVVSPDFQSGEATLVEGQETVITLHVSVTANHRQGDGYYVDHIRLAMNQNYSVCVGEYVGQASCVTLTVNTGEESAS